MPLKGFEYGGHQEKAERHKFMVAEDVSKLLGAANSARMRSPLAIRDYALIYMAYGFGLRCGEVILLRRESFRALDDGIVYLPTLKQWKRYKVWCRKCSTPKNIGRKKVGTRVQCQKCGNIFVAQAKLSKEAAGPVEKPTPVMEGELIDFCHDYLDNHMHPSQKWLFCRKPNKYLRDRWKNCPPHIGERTAEKIFDKYLIAAGLSIKYSFHSLRHGRAVLIWDQTGDLQAVKSLMRHQNIQTSEGYMHLSPKKTRDMREALSEGLRAANPGRK